MLPLNRGTVGRESGDSKTNFRSCVFKETVISERRYMMKKRYLLFVLLSSFYSAGNSQSVYQDILPKFNKIQPLGEKCIESVMPFFDPHNANGEATSDTLTYGNGQELLRQILWLKSKDLNDYETLDSQRKSIELEYVAKDILPLTVMDYRYKAMRDSVRDYGLKVGLDSMFEFKTGVNDPKLFENNYLFAYTMPLENIRSDFKQMVIDERLILGNLKLNAQGKWRMKFGNAEVNVQLNVPFHIPVGADSVVICELSYEVPEGDERVGYMETPWYNTSSTAKVVCTQLLMVNVSNEILGVFEGQGLVMKTINAFPGLPDLRANISIHYGKNKYGGLNVCMAKPIIFVEGIDFGYKGYPIGERDAKCGSMGYLDLMKGKQWNVEKQKWETNLAIAQAPAVLKKYRNAGYDIIYVDFFDGAADMDFNSEVLIKVIQEVQSTMCGDKVHVVGVSMGGILAKMALKKMENRNLPNCVSSYTSFDAPHQGANIPLGVQRFVSHVSSISGDCKDIRDRMLRRPAARQLLVLHESSNRGHDQLRQDYLRWDSLQGGYPKNVWLLNVVNGSGLGDKGAVKKMDGNSLSPGDEILSVRFLNPIFGFFKALTTTRIATIYATHKKIGSNTGVVANINGMFFDKYLYSDLSNVQLDHVNGSWNEAVSSFQDFGKFGNIFLKTTFGTKKTTFVPSVSALDMKSKFPLMVNNVDIYNKPFSVNDKTFSEILGSKYSTPFQRVYVPKTNQEHAFLDSSSDGNTMWLLAELNKLSDIEHPNIVKTNFNFRDVMSLHVKSLEVYNGAKFELNGTGISPKISKDDSLMNRTMAQRKFVSSMCGESRYMVTDSSEFSVGNKNSKTIFVMHNLSKLTLKKGSKLNISAGLNKLQMTSGSVIEIGENCILEIGNGAQLIVESGSTLHLKLGSKIILNGQGAMLHIKGNLVLDSGVLFEPISRGSSLVGMVKITNKGYGYGDGKIVTKGNNVKMKFVGNGKESYSNLQLEGPVKFPFTRTSSGKDINQLIIDNSSVNFDGTGAIVVGGKVSLRGSKFKSVDWAKGNGKGLVYLGDNLDIQQCNFDDLDTGIRVTAQNLGLFNAMSGLGIQNCKVGMVFQGAGIRISGGKFEYNRKGIIFEELTDELLVEDCIFSDNSDYGVWVSNDYVNRAYAFFLRNDFYRNKIGAKFTKQNLLSRCNYFALNQVGLDMVKSKLNISSSVYKKSDFLDKTINGGNNSFSNSYTTSILLTDAMPYLEGNNNFNRSANFSGGKIHISGSVEMDYNQPYWDASLTKVLVGLNYWYPKRNNFNADSIDVNYVDLVVGGTASNNGKPLKLIGGLSGKFNEDLCYNATKQTDFTDGFKMDKKDENLMGQPNNKVIVSATADGFKVEGENVKIFVYNSSGQIVFKGETVGTGSHFYNLSTGIYFVKVSGNAGSESKKIFVTN